MSPLELNEILESLKRNELKLALHWCENHRLALKNRSVHLLDFTILAQKTCLVPENY